MPGEFFIERKDVFPAQNVINNQQTIHKIKGSICVDIYSVRDGGTSGAADAGEHFMDKCPDLRTCGMIYGLLEQYNL